MFQKKNTECFIADADLSFVCVYVWHVGVWLSHETSKETDHEKSKRHVM